MLFYYRERLRIFLRMTIRVIKTWLHCHLNPTCEGYWHGGEQEVYTIYRRYITRLFQSKRDALEGK